MDKILVSIISVLIVIVLISTIFLGDNGLKKQIENKGTEAIQSIENLNVN